MILEALRQLLIDRALDTSGDLYGALFDEDGDTLVTDDGLSLSSSISTTGASTKIFIGAMPLTIVPGIRLMILPPGGADADVPGIHRSYVQAAARAATWGAAFNLALATGEALTFDFTTAPGVEISSSRPWTPTPFSLGREEGAHWLMAVNLTVVWKRK